MKTMKRLYLAIAIMAMVIVCGTAHTEIFVYDDGTQLTVSWPDDSDALYYEVTAINLTESTKKITKSVFESPAIIGGFTYHDIYYVTVKAWNDAEEVFKFVGAKYITFALEQTSGDCVCICPELVIPKKVFYGLISDIWWTGIAINNVGDTSQAVVLKVGVISKVIVVPSHTVKVSLLKDLIDDATPRAYPITYETESADIGITVLIGDSINVCAQN